MSTDSNLDALKWISQEYYVMNGTHYTTLEEPPTSLQFSQLAHISRPVLMKGFKIPAQDRWTDKYLLEKMGEQETTVAVTPNGRADAVTLGPDGKRYFAEPHNRTMKFSEFLEKLTTTNSDNNIHYLQSQNGNMYNAVYFAQGADHHVSEFDPLRSDVPADVPWCTEVFGKNPDAVNIWIGNSQSVTSIHSDPYENIYTVIRGEKKILLLPPTDSWRLRERTFPHAVYQPVSPGSSTLNLIPSLDVPAIRWSSITDPYDLPDAHPLVIRVKAGETLYLPAGWWHYVEQSSREITVAINWWYDIEVRGMTWVLLSYLRGSSGNEPPADDAVAS